MRFMYRERTLQRSFKRFLLATKLSPNLLTPPDALACSFTPGQPGNNWHLPSQPCDQKTHIAHTFKNLHSYTYLSYLPLSDHLGVFLQLSSVHLKHRDIRAVEYWLFTDSRITTPPDCCAGAIKNPATATPLYYLFVMVAVWAINHQAHLSPMYAQPRALKKIIQPHLCSGEMNSSWRIQHCPFRLVQDAPSTDSKNMHYQFHLQTTYFFDKRHTFSRKDIDPYSHTLDPKHDLRELTQRGCATVFGNQ